MIKFDGLDDAILGVVQIHCQEQRLIYDWEKCVEIFMSVEGWTYEEAVEWMDFNVTCLYAGETTPGFLYKEYDLDL